MSRALLLAGPALVAGVSFLWLALEARTWAPWASIVHEDARRTLAETILYPRHFLRELPVLGFYVAAVAVSLPRGARAGRRGPGWLWWLAAGVLVGTAGLAVLLRDGAGVAAGDLGQFYRRDDEGAPGAHWGAHAMSNLVFLAVAWTVAAPWRGAASVARAGAAAMLAAAGLVSVVFVADPVAAVLGPRAAAHQVREIATHVAITLPIALAVLVDPRALGRAGFGPRSTGWGGLGPAGIGAIAGAGLLAGLAIGGDALRQASGPWSAHLAAHVFEHTLDYVLVLLLCLGLRRPREPRGGALPDAAVPLDDVPAVRVNGP